MPLYHATTKGNCGNRLLGQFGSGMRFRLGCTLVLLPEKPLCALQTTHNALLDARALRLWYADEASAAACTEPNAAGL